MEFYYYVNYEKNNGESEYYGWILIFIRRKGNKIILNEKLKIKKKKIIEFEIILILILIWNNWRNLSE